MNKTGTKRWGWWLLLLLPLCYFLLPHYAREALRYLYPDITDTFIFPSDRLEKAEVSWDFPQARAYNTYALDAAEEAGIEEYGTVAYLVVSNDSVLYEEYRDNWRADSLSNLFSATKSIVGLLVGIAWDEGLIGSLDDKVSVYLPEFPEGGRLTVRNLLTMSSGLDWDEAYTSLFSKTTEAYYGDNIRKLVMGLKVVEEPGIRYSYKSGDTQLLSFVLEGALEKAVRAGGYGRDSVWRPVGPDFPRTISKYAEQRLWKPVQASKDALWNLDRKGGDEKTYCCFNTTARDLAHIGRLILGKGRWNGRQVVSEAYLEEAVSPASYLENEFGDGPLDYYGFQIWIMHYRGMSFPAFRGLGGQYLFVIPQMDAVIVRLGHERSDEYRRENTLDMYRYLDIAFRILQGRPSR